MKIRKATQQDMPQVIDVINTTFGQVRDYDFDIRDVQPKVYSSSQDYSDIHTIVEEDNKIISVAGCYKNCVNVSGKQYPFSILGSVATLPEYQGKGYFKKLISTVIENSQQQGDVFMMLTGLRHRYNYFGFEKCGFRYYFDIDINFCKYQDSLQGLTLVEYTKQDLDSIYNIFIQKNPVIPRQKQDFALTLKTSHSEIFVYKLNGKTIGYTTFSFLKNRVNEINVPNQYLPYCVKLLFEKFNQHNITIVVSPYDKDTVKILDTFAEDKKSTEQIHFKVFDMVKFLTMVLELNKSIKTLTDCQHIVKIDNQTIDITISDNNIKVTLTDAQPTRCFSESEFLRYIFSLTSLYDYNENLPLFLDFNYADLF